MNAPRQATIAPRSAPPAAPEIRIGRWSFGPDALLRVALLATALVYLQTISYGFVYDDLPEIIMNPWAQSFRYWREILGNNFWAFVHSVGNYYRPVTSFWLVINYSLFHSTPGWWHLTSLAAHVVATGLVYLLACRLLGDRTTAAIAAALFGLDPIHVEPVSWISSIPEILMAIFYIAAFLTFERAREKDRRSPIYISALLYGLALLSKETAVAFLPVIAVWAWTRSSQVRSRLLLWIEQMSPYVLISVAYFAARIHALGGLERAYYPRTWMQVVSTWPAAMWIYVRGMLWPFPPKPAYDLDLVTRFSFSAVVLPLILATAGIAAVAWILRKQKMSAFAVAWIVMPLVPVLIGIRVFQWHDFAHDRYMYLSSVMVAIAVAYLLQRISEKTGTRRVQLAAALLISAAFAITTVISTRAWDTDLTLFARSYQTAPHNPLAGVDYAQNYCTYGDVNRCMALLQEVVKENPNYYEGNFILGLTYYRVGRNQEAEKYLSIAARSWMRSLEYPDGSLFYYLGIVQERNGEYQAAERSLRNAITLQPHSLSYHYQLASILDRLGRHAEAQEQVRLENENRRLYQKKQQAFDP